MRDYCEAAEAMVVACLVAGAVLLVGRHVCWVLRHRVTAACNYLHAFPRGWALTGVGRRSPQVIACSLCICGATLANCCHAAPDECSSSESSWSCCRGREIVVRAASRTSTGACTSAQACLPEKTRMARLRGRWMDDGRRCSAWRLGGCARAFRICGRALHRLSMRFWQVPHPFHACSVSLS